MGGVVVLLVVIVLVLWVLASCIRIVPQAYAVVLERLGAYITTCRFCFVPFIFATWSC